MEFYCSLISQQKEKKKKTTIKQQNNQPPTKSWNHLNTPDCTQLSSHTNFQAIPKSDFKPLAPHHNSIQTFSPQPIAGACHPGGVLLQSHQPDFPQLFKSLFGPVCDEGIDLLCVLLSVRLNLHTHTLKLWAGDELTTSIQQGCGCPMLKQQLHNLAVTWTKAHSRNGKRGMVMCSRAIIMILIVFLLPHNSIHPPEMEINPPKMACGCPDGGVIKNKKQSHMHSSCPVEYICQHTTAYIRWVTPRVFR